MPHLFAGKWPHVRGGHALLGISCQAVDAKPSHVRERHARPLVSCHPLGEKGPHMRETRAHPLGLRHRVAHIPLVPSRFQPGWHETGQSARAPCPVSWHIARTSQSFLPLSGPRLAHIPRFPVNEAEFWTEPTTSARTAGRNWPHVRGTYALPPVSCHRLGGKSPHVRERAPSARSRTILPRPPATSVGDPTGDDATPSCHRLRTQDIYNGRSRDPH
jgi:hypothetical protein